MRIIWGKRFMPPGNAFGDSLLNDEAFQSGAMQGLLKVSQADHPVSDFFENVRNCVQSSLELDVDFGASAKPSLFVFDKSPRIAASKFGTATRVQDLELQGSGQWQGQIVFAAQHGSNGWAVPLPNGSIHEAVNALIGDFGSTPAAVFHPEKRVLSCAFGGLISEDAPVKLSLPLERRTVSLEDIRDVLKLVAEDGFLIPDICPPKFWGKPDKYVPGEETERALQWGVAAEMRGYFRPLLIERERAVNIGRIDILFTDLHAVHPKDRHPAVVEVKVLRSFYSTENPVPAKSNVYSMVKGMGQAKSYRVRKDAKISTLAVFDLRKDKTDILSEPLVQKAKEKFYDAAIDTVMLPIYGVTAHAQEAVAIAG